MLSIPLSATDIPTITSVSPHDLSCTCSSFKKYIDSILYLLEYVTAITIFVKGKLFKEQNSRPSHNAKFVQQENRTLNVKGTLANKQNGQKDPKKHYYNARIIL